MSEWIRKPSYVPEEVASRCLVRLLVKLNILTYDKHMDIIMRYRSRS